jgi:hypothetical protein
MTLDMINEENSKIHLSKLKEYYRLEKELLNNLEILLKEYSIENVNFTESKINSFVEEIDTLQ